MLYLWLSYKFSETFVDVELDCELKFKCETIIHDSLQMLKTKESNIILPQERSEKLYVTTKNNKHFTKQPKITKNDTAEKLVPHKQLENS
ncbi:hypothetical protein C2G38_2212312 [Gigaspora rosea]|uniref:ATP-dependent RNA helicase SUV3 C-terminal domain-containing protein n=1 Tax=Gigaspora rosea TaxID=44941 RepID=A0A397UCW6_9GLOM|nr:hypothetical protein C2G38_2212312 [Gigaspora rosea]